MKNNYFKLILFFALSSFVFSCSNEDEQQAQKPTIDKVELGLGNNEIGVIGQDFHFNAEITAGDKIKNVEIKIDQISTETYSKVWSHQIIWEQYAGAKNTVVHKHFDIPADAAEGKYSFLIVVTDQNGTKLEERRTLTIYAPENLPLDLKFDFGIDAVDSDFAPIKVIYAQRSIYDSESYKSDEPINEDEFLAPVVNIAAIKGDGKMYCLIINKKHNHRPETITAIDFSKAVVVDVWEHKNIQQSQLGSNMFDFSTNPLTILYPAIKIGATSDKNLPSPNAVSNLKKWESGQYYVGFIYHNTTYNMTLFHYGEIKVQMK
ncbi:DUF4625 domain-containing protein [Flavobacterium hercynium]|uniref:DUF4625 domain-containing protein n=1 Tax=Flavobacterium hercynium TaxID=387094 RepID=A0A226GXL2_9FLAO|nr:DUF4625 domain-containing protein [Flavobacterium hercynium]OXA86030.1 hypothetical protein B0A66_18365 [Flavobacterium hercynium]SMP15711.1 protein of unknown function [Flavobacterium hercynium]